jgi:dTDP-4-dehydrorhamnose reductase
MTAMPRPILVTGGAGMLGRAVSRAAKQRGVVLVGLDRSTLDITDFARVHKAIRETRPRVVLNLAAYTAVDRAEREADRALAVNKVGAANVATASAEFGARMMHVSTDYVFDGRAHRPYRPTDTANPINVYGRTKFLGEEAIRGQLEDHLIVRTSWLFAPWGNNFVRTIAQHSRADRPLRVVADQRGRPTSAVDLAEVLLDLAESDAQGTLHFANAGATTWHGFAEAVVGMLGDLRSSVKQQIIPISTAEFPTAAPRPAYSVLDTDSFSAATGIVPRSWSVALSETLAELE